MKSDKVLYRKRSNSTSMGKARNKNKRSKHSRGTKDGIKRSMGNKSKKDGWLYYDYRPLYRFLTMSVGKEWDGVYKEACSKLNYREPIYQLVIVDNSKWVIKGRVNIEGRQYRALTVKDGILVRMSKKKIQIPPQYVIRV